MMLFFTIIFALTYLSEAFHLKIANGTDAKEGEFPFMVSLRALDEHICGGTILDNKHILTASSCVYIDASLAPNASDFTIQYGTINSTSQPNKQIQIEKICMSAQFDKYERMFDYAILTLVSELPANDPSWAIVPTAPSDYLTNLPQTGTIIGWGTLWQDGPTPEILQKLSVDIYTTQQCSSVPLMKIRHNICSGAAVGSACLGDAGSPLLSEDGLQIGIGSYTINQNCQNANIERPNVYARLSHYIELIRFIIAEDLDQLCKDIY